MSKMLTNKEIVEFEKHQWFACIQTDRPDAPCICGDTFRHAVAKANRKLRLGLIDALFNSNGILNV